MSSLSAPGPGFYRLEVNERWPPVLRTDLPEILWIPPDAVLGAAPVGPSMAILRGMPLDGLNAKAVTLVSLDDGGAPRLHFDVARTMEGILLEEYHGGLEPTVEMRLPFNYSLLPCWVKALARNLRKGKIAREPEVPFPPGDPSFVVDWLRELARWAQGPPSPRSLSVRWPAGFRAALTISHDVDTDWLFRHPAWLERICDLEEHYGLRGAWYCVPRYSHSRAAEAGIERLLARGCEVGCHGYNHDGKWPLLRGDKYDERVRRVRQFRDFWGLRGFRPEWLWRTPTFLATLAQLFDYDTSVPTVSSGFTSHSRNGCGTCWPYVTHGDLLELPLTVPMDEARHLSGLEPGPFWRGQFERSRKILERGGLVMLSLHPQPHQAANEATLTAVAAALQELVDVPGVWIARPDQIADWARGCVQACPGQPNHACH